MRIRYIDVRGMAPVDIPDLFAARSVPYIPVQCVNWPDRFPACPDCRFAMACSPEGLLVHFQVTEEHARAVTGQDGGPVWEDSCVEFFFSPAGSGMYYNVECNCVGCLLVAVGAGRHGREKANPDLLGRIGRWTSLGDVPFGEKDEKTTWEVALTIPISVFWKHRFNLANDLEGTVNVYACREGCHPHFLSLFPIASERPDFHRPECFRRIVFACQEHF